MNKVKQAHEEHLPNDPDQKASDPLEEQLRSMLTEGEMETEEKDEAVRRRVIPRTEIRIQTTMDPIVEETLKFRSMAREVDNRYDRYMERANRGNRDQE